MAKAPDAFRTISEASDALKTPAHVLRFWESKFSQVKPVKRAGGRRYYRPTDIDLLSGIRTLLHDQGMTIRGVQKMIADKGVQHIAQIAPLSHIYGPAGAVEADNTSAATPPSHETAPAPATSDPLQADATPEPAVSSCIRQEAPVSQIQAGSLARALRKTPPTPDRLHAAHPFITRLEAMLARMIGAA